MVHVGFHRMAEALQFRRRRSVSPRLRRRHAFERLEPRHLLAGAVDNVPEVAAQGYQLVYELPIPDMADFVGGTAVPYSIDNSDTVGEFDRVAYYLELDDGNGLQYVYASMDAFTNDATQLGLPHNVDNPVVHQRIVDDMNVFSSHPGVTTGVGIATGNIEMWPSNYNQSNAIGIPGASASTFDFGDGNASTAAGHGSFQVHNHGAGEVLLAYNDWGGNTPGTVDELGIGTAPSGEPDWTFTKNTNLYTVKNLQILVRPTPVPIDAPAAIQAVVPEAVDYRLVYELPIDNTTFDPSQYAVDNTAAHPDGQFDRVAYFLELDDGAGPQHVWVSMDAFTQRADLTGVPNTAAHIQQRIVDNMNVVASAGVTTGSSIATGNIEFWPTNYAGAVTPLIPGGGSDWDFNDTRTVAGTYGSMQVHNHGAGQTLFAYNRFNGVEASDLGIGNAPQVNTDWTFSGNAATYTAKRLYVLVRPSEGPQPLPAPPAIVAAVPEAAEYELVYHLPIHDQFFDVGKYAVDNAAAHADNSFDRVAYYLELDNGGGPQYVWVSMDAFTQRADLIGVPNTTAHFQQRIVSNMNVAASPAAGVTTGSGIATGNIEFWNTNYETVETAVVPGGDGSLYDFDDNPTPGGYGSMQVHNHGAGETLFAYNRFNDDLNSDVGIGNNPSGHPDWTFIQNAGTYTAKNLYALVRPRAPLPAPQHIVGNVPEAAGFNLVYQLPIQDAGFDPSHYTVDNTAVHPPGSFERVAYYLELDDGGGSQFVWVSLDAFTDRADLLGVPNTGDHFQQRLVDNMNVAASPGTPVATGTGIATGNIEFWNTNYSHEETAIVPGGSNDVWDFDDIPTPGDYGSMQVHNYAAGETIFAFNRWGGPRAELDLGIGNFTGANPDWTFAENSTGYAVKNLYVLVEKPATPALIGHWTFDVDFTDSSGNANHGTGAGDAAAGVGATPSPVGGGYLELDGTGDFVDVGVVVPSGSYTKAAWVRLDAAFVGANPNVFSSGGGGDHALFAPGGTLAAGQAGSVQQVNDTQPLPLDAWTHVAVTYDALRDEMRLYRDGVQVGTTATGVGGATQSTANDRIGNFVNVETWTGQIDDVGLWDAALDGGQIAEVYAAGLAGDDLAQTLDAPTGVVATATSHDTILVSWDEVVGADAYIVRRDGTPVGETAATVFADTGLQPTTEYAFDVAAVSFRGVSPFSAPPAVATTLSSPPQVDFTELPTDLQLYPRDVDTNTAVVSIAGEETVGGFDAVGLRVWRDDVLLGSERLEPLVYDEGPAAFTFDTEIVAELSNYDFELFVTSGGEELPLTTVEDVVAGDVFMIQGQSNADAQMYNGSANVEQGPFIRTFGFNTENSGLTAADQSWHVAQGDGSLNRTAGVGQWGLRFGRRMVDAYQMPVAVINGAHGGRAIGFFQRNDADPEDLTTNYGRLLHRAEAAGVAHDVRAMLWYQGESDVNNGEVHETGFVALYNDWKEDYSGIEKFYVHQLRVGCMVTATDVDLRDRQRRLPDTYDDIEVMSTTGIDGHDGCHFAYDNGYRLIGDHIFDLVARDMYGAALTVDVEAPNIDFAFFNNAARDEVTLVMRNPVDSLVWDAGSENYFHLEGSAETVTAGAVDGHTLVLDLSSDPVGATGISYIGHTGAGPWVTNSRGVGMLTFSNIPIAATAPVEVAGRHVAYGGSAFGDAPAPDKTALAPGQQATAANYTNFSGGINRVVVDVDFLPTTTLTTGDFTLRVGNDNDPSLWAAAPGPQSIGVDRFAGVDGAHRITLSWNDGAIANEWLEVTLLANTNTGLPADDTFYFGNAVGETANDSRNALVTAADLIAIRNHPRGAGNRADIVDPHDVDRDRLVDAIDALLARNAATGPLDALRLITPLEPATAPPAEGEASSVGARTHLLLHGRDADTGELTADRMPTTSVGMAPELTPSLLDALSRWRGLW